MNVYKYFGMIALITLLLSACGAPSAAPGNTQAAASTPQSPSAAPSPSLVPQASSSPTAQAAAEEGQPAAQEQTVNIEISDNNFTPPALTVAPGTTVVWTNKGQRPHTVTADDGTFKSETLQVGDTFQHTFDQAGTFAYFCEFHGGAGGVGMSGTITVGEGGAAAAPPDGETPPNVEPTVGAAQATDQELELKFAHAGDKRLASASLDLSAIQAPPSGKVHAVWLIGDDGQYVLLGPAPVGQTFTYTDPAGENLVGKTVGAMVSLEAPANAEAKSLAAPTDLLFAGVQPTAILGDIRLLVVAAPDTPNAVPYDPALKDQAALAATHGQLALDGITKGDLHAGRLHVEHVWNILSGAASPDFGDLDGNGEAQNPGDGYGVWPYAFKITEIVERIAETPGLSDHIRETAANMAVCARNISDDWGPAVREQGQLVLAAADAAAAEAAALQLASLTKAVAEGTDANNNGTIEPVKGECGAQHVYELSHDLFHIHLTPQTTPPVVSVPAPTAQPVAASPAAIDSQAHVEIEDNAFAPPELEVPVGTTVIWEHHGQRPHTVSADNGAFSSGTLEHATTFAWTFDQPGVYAYYCEFHGGSGGAGMAGVIRVGDG